MVNVYNNYLHLKSEAGGANDEVLEGLSWEQAGTLSPQLCEAWPWQVEGEEVRQDSDVVVHLGFQEFPLKIIKRIW